jgi:hypothetical protein
MQRATPVGSVRRCRRPNPGATRPLLHSTVGATPSLHERRLTAIGVELMVATRLRNVGSRCLREAWHEFFYASAAGGLHEPRRLKLGSARHTRINLTDVARPPTFGGKQDL